MTGDIIRRRLPPTPGLPLRHESENAANQAENASLMEEYTKELYCGARTRHTIKTYGIAVKDFPRLHQGTRRARSDG